MGQERITQLLQQGIAAAKNNRLDIARGLFQRVVELDPRNEIAWAWLASVARDDRERLSFLKRLWEINPQNAYAIKGLRALGIEPGGRAREAPRRSTQEMTAQPVPLLDEAKFTRTQQAADEFLHRYPQKPPDRLGVQWEHRTHNRYGEQDAKRLRQFIVVGTVSVAVLLVIGIVWGLSQVKLGGSEQAALAIRRLTATPTATLTPTPGGSTPTPFPAQLAFAPTRIPEGWAAGSAYGIASPTPLYPRAHTNVEHIVQQALSYYAIGDYDQAAEMLREERERSEPHCYPALVYYEALSEAHRGKFRDAEDVLEWAQDYQPARGYNSCQGAPLLAAGLAEVAYLRDPQSDDALAYSEQALQADPRLVAAALTKGRALLARGALTEAAQTVSRALQEYPQDTNLLLLAAEVELANGQPAAALDYIGRALYVDPDLLPALRLQAQTYLALAEQAAPDSKRRLQAYGLAVRSAQTLLFYYQGDPSGYLYLAQARLGEGNDTLAETALTRILAAEENLPEDAAPTVDEAYWLRGKLRYGQGRFEEAFEDLQTYANRAETPHSAALEALIMCALHTGDYSTARLWIEILAEREPENATYQLWRAQVQVELCTLHPEALTCDYADALETLSDDFVAALEDDAQRAQAFSYRAQARYRETMRRQTALSEEQRQADLQTALTDIEAALAVRETAFDHYTHGLILEALEESSPAYEAYLWVDIWRANYPYPFADEDFQTRFEAVAAVAHADHAHEGEAQPETTRTPGAPSPTASPTATPTATPTGVPVNDYIP